MARKHLTKVKVAEGLQANDGFYKAAIYKVGEAGKVKKDVPTSVLLVNPSTIEDSKSGNWVEHNIPGQSDPIVQWISGGVRTLSFTALVTKDTIHSDSDTSSNPIAAIADSVANVVGGIASKLAGVNLPPLLDVMNIISSPELDDTEKRLAVSTELDYYRSLMYPKIEEGTLAASPPLVVLALGKTLRAVPEKITPDADLWVAKRVSVKVTKWLPNLTPMEAEVSFQFIQYTINSRGRGT